MNNMSSPTAPQTNVTVMASAGTGKTWLLVTRLLRLLMTGTNPGSILAITFTRKAAAEMQSRLAERLYGLAAANESELDSQLTAMEIDPLPEHRALARKLYEDLLHAPWPIRTSTFHAFCQDILRRFPLEANIPPGFELMEKTAELERSAWDALIAETTSAPNGDTAQALENLLTHCGGLHNLDQALNSFLQQRSDWWAYTQGQNDPVSFAMKQLYTQLGISFDQNPLRDFFTPEREKSLWEFKGLLAKHPGKKNDEAANRIEQSLDENGPIETRFYILQRAFLTQKNEPQARKESATQAKKMSEAGQEQFLQLHQQLSAQLLDTLDKLAAKKTAQMNQAWYQSGIALLQHLQRIKEEQRLLDFADLEWKACQLLTTADNAHWIQYKLDQRIDHLLVDEFQDTNPTQWHLLLPLLQEMAAGESERQRSVFLVGDAKQSIYRFRRADPGLFSAADQWLSEHLNARQHTQQKSWRSAPAIMEAVNRIFTDTPLGNQLTDFTAHSTHHQNLWGQVTVLPLIQADNETVEEDVSSELRNPLQQPRQMLFDDRYQREGEMIASQIQALVNSSTLLGNEAEARPARYGDIMILLRNRTHVHFYESALRQVGIPYLGADRGTLLESLEVRDMLALLETLITPYSNLALATVLRSPLFAWSNEQLMQLARANHKQGTWLERLTQLAEDKSVDANIAYTCETLSRWLSLAGHLPVHDLLDKIYSEGDVLARYQAAYPTHLKTRAQANLIRFIELALEIDSGRYPSLHRFHTYLNELRQYSQEAPDETPVAGDGDRIRIMTIHGAKGLEAPIVFLADASSEPKRDHGYRALVDWPSGQAQPQSFLVAGKKSQQDAFTRLRLEREQQEEARESANLLYVALTRARQLLYISGCQSRKKTESEKGGWYGHISRALMQEGESFSDEAQVITSGKTPTQATVQKITTIKSWPIPEGLNKPLPRNQTLHEIAPSRSVSHTHVSTDTDEDGKQRGIAIHRILEYLSQATQAEHQTSKLPETIASELCLAENDADFQSWWQEAQQVINSPELAFLFDDKNYQQAWNEVPIQYQHRGQERAVYGIIDRLVMSKEEVIVVDYKTHQSASNNNINELAEKYKPQMEYYLQGARELWPGLKVRGMLLFTTCNEVFEY